MDRHAVKGDRGGFKIPAVKRLSDNTQNHLSPLTGEKEWGGERY